MKSKKTEPSSAASADRDLSGGLSVRLQALIRERPDGDFQVRDLFRALEGRGHAALLVVIALPFSLPLPLFGLSTIFGLILAFIGLRIAFRRRPWLPRWILAKPMRKRTLEAMQLRVAKLERRAHRVLRPRLSWICHHTGLHRVHGIVVAILGLLLALPLPIPATNLVAAIPILLIGLALLEDDGRFMIFGHFIAVVSIGIFVGLVWASGLGVEHLMEFLRQSIP